MVHEEANLTSNRSPQELVQSVLVSWWLWGLLLWTDSVTHTQQTMQRQILNCIDAIAKKKKKKNVDSIRTRSVQRKSFSSPSHLTPLSKTPSATWEKLGLQREILIFSFVALLHTVCITSGRPGTYPMVSMVDCRFSIDSLSILEFHKIWPPTRHHQRSSSVVNGICEKKKKWTRGKIDVVFPPPRLSNVSLMNG